MLPWMAFSVCLLLVYAEQPERRLQEPIPLEVLEHSPIFISRKDQLLNTGSDRILKIGYSEIEKPDQTRVIRYTVFFSDEDSKKTVSGTDHQMARYGRKLDIEWAYEVTLNSKSGEAISRTYHCDALLGVGHRRCTFRGSYEPGGLRPILYINAKHNVFGDRPHFPYGTSHGIRFDIEPTVSIPYPKSRDIIPLEYPELLQESDIELSKEGKLSRFSTEYIFVRIRGNFLGSFLFKLSDRSGFHSKNGRNHLDTIQKLGEGLWGKEGVIAIPITPSKKENLRLGIEKFDIRPIFLGPPQRQTSFFKLEDVGLYLVDKNKDGKYETQDLSRQISCLNKEKLFDCTIN